MRLLDLVGCRFGRLVVITRLPGLTPYRKVLWRCQCDCGAVTNVITAHLRNRNTTSCGCARRDAAVRTMTTHGHTAHLNRPAEFRAWLNARHRCDDATRPEYKNYGGRGITMCDLWRNSYAAFYAHMGPKPTPQHSIDRINNDGHYEPGNCRWATRSQQNKNTRRSPSRRIF